MNKDTQASRSANENGEGSVALDHVDVEDSPLFIPEGPPSPQIPELATGDLDEQDTEKRRRRTLYTEPYENLLKRIELSHQRDKYLRQRKKIFQDRRKAAQDRLHDIELERVDLLRKLEDLNIQEQKFSHEFTVDQKVVERNEDVKRRFEEYFEMRSNGLPEA